MNPLHPPVARNLYLGPIGMVISSAKIAWSDIFICWVTRFGQTTTREGSAIGIFSNPIAAMGL
jgi:hypothetical protein